MRLIFAFLVSTLAAAVTLFADPADAQTYPSKPIHILIPYAPGGIADIAARILGAKLTEAWGQQVVVENKPGGNGFIAISAAAKATPDGYTLVMATAGDLTLSPALFKDMPYNVQNDFAFISLVSDAPLVLAANTQSPFKSVADVLAGAKAQPGRISIASPGNGSNNQLVIEWMGLNTGTQFQHIPYKGGAPAAAALAGNDIPLAVLASSSVAPHVKSGRAVVLAITAAHRSKLNPEWPTLQEQGVKDVDASNWTALLAPKGTPKDIVDKLHAEIVKILAMSDVKDRFAGGGVQVVGSSPAELQARVKDEGARFLQVVQKANMKPD
jgi:tripartite-type tricarboxylate transporter receptor subunit TctC